MFKLYKFLKNKTSLSLLNKNLNMINEIKDGFVSKCNDQIEIHNRKLNQINKLLAYNISNITYFDFFSFESFEIIKNCKFIARYLKKQDISYDCFFLSLFDFKFKIKLLSDIFNLNNLPKILKLKTFVLVNPLFNLKKFIKRNENNFYIDKFKITFIYKYVYSLFNKNDNKKIKFSNEILELFKKSAHNSLIRFKEPIITPEVIFITIMDENQLKINKLIKNYLNINNVDWLLLKYDIFKYLFNQNKILNANIDNKQIQFAYLLKTQLSESQFQKIIEKKELKELVSYFKELLITKYLKADIFKDFNYETHISISLSTKRFYSDLFYD